MVEINFKNGSTIKTGTNNDIVRGYRSKIDPYNYGETYIDTKMVKEVIDKFVNKERLSKQDADQDVYLSSAWNKEELEDEQM